MFTELPLPAPDEIVPLMLRAARDKRPEKTDMTVGVYRDDNGLTPIMEAVRKADQYLSVHRLTKTYVGSFGDPEFVSHIQDLAFTKPLEKKFIRGIQTPGGSSALSLILQMIKKARPKMLVWVSDPGYVNHGATIKAIGLELGEYPFLNRETMGLKKKALMRTLKSLGPGDAVIFHGSCHNPTGLKLSDHHWHEISKIAQERGFYPIIDTAYQGLGDGIIDDAKGLMIMAQNLDNLALSFSCSKNFGLYNDRVACAFIMSKDKKEAVCGQIQLAAMARPAHWVPPQNGAEIVKHILSNPGLKTLWLKELETMNKRISGLRAKLSEMLRIQTGTNDYDYIAKNSGMFSMLPGTPEQMEILRKDHAVYGLDDGRINIAGLGAERIGHAAKSIAAVLNR